MALRLLIIGHAFLEVPTWTEDLAIAPKAKWKIAEVKNKAGAPRGQSHGNAAFVMADRFSQFVKLEELGGVFDPGGPLSMCDKRPCRITESHAVAFDRVRDSLFARYPEDIAIQCMCPACLGDKAKWQEHVPRSNPYLALAEWLSYWTRWAINNCDTPAMFVR